jgi:hypothetical protein
MLFEGDLARMAGRRWFKKIVTKVACTRLTSFSQSIQIEWGNYSIMGGLPVVRVSGVCELGVGRPPQCRHPRTIIGERLIQQREQKYSED